MSLTKSEFAALRAVAHLLSAEGKVETQQAKWFLDLTRNYGVTHDQHEILRGDLAGSSQLLEIHSEITSAKDRERLLNWARVVMSVDHKPHPKEKEVYAKIKSLNERYDVHLREDYHDAAKSILQIEKGTKMWKDLEEAGQMFSEPYYGGYSGLSNSSYAGGAAVALFAKAFASRNRFAIGFILILIVLFLIWEFSITNCSRSY